MISPHSLWVFPRSASHAVLFYTTIFFSLFQDGKSFSFMYNFFVATVHTLRNSALRNACMSEFMDIIRTLFSGNPHQALIYCDLCTDIRLHPLPGIRMIHIILGAFLACHIIMPDHLLSSQPKSGAQPCSQLYYRIISFLFKNAGIIFMTALNGNTVHIP